MKNLQKRVRMSDFKFSQTSLKRLEGVDEKLVKVVKRAIKETNVDFAVAEGLRSAERQNELYKKGYTELDGYNKKSAHQLGLAVDIVPYVKEKGGALWKLKGNEAEWLEVGRAMLRSARLLGVDLEWGITYNLKRGVDAPHFQLKR